MQAKKVLYFNDRYKGSLTDTQCEELEALIELNKNKDSVQSLRHVIYDMDEADVDTMIYEYENLGYGFTECQKKVGTLRYYQTTAVAFAYHAGNLLLGDEVGLGKTVVSAGLVNLLKSDYRAQGLGDFKFLALTTKNVCEQFRKEMVRFTGGFIVRIPSGEAGDLDKFINWYTPLEYSVVGTHALITASKFIGWLEMQKEANGGYPFDLLIVDESSLLGGKTTTQTVKSFKAIAKNFKRIIFLNATPFESHLTTFYNQLNLLDSKLLPTKQNFDSEYCIMRWNGRYKTPSGKYKNQGHFKRLVGYRYFARTREEQGAKMIDCSGRVVMSPLSSVQKEWLRKTQLNKMVYDCPNYFDKTIAFNETNVPKLSSVKELLENDCSDAATVLMFVYNKEAQYSLSDWLFSQGVSNMVLNGDTKQKERAEIIEKFNNADFRVLITNVQKGLNFGNCDYCIFYSFDVNPSQMSQFEGRMTRSFDIIGKHVYLLCSEGAEEKRLNEVLRERAKATVTLTNAGMSIIMGKLLGGVKKDESEEGVSD